MRDIYTCSTLLYHSAKERGIYLGTLVFEPEANSLYLRLARNRVAKAHELHVVNGGVRVRTTRLLCTTVQ